jgi:hypothetical protein
MAAGCLQIMQAVSSTGKGEVFIYFVLFQAGTAQPI